MIRRVLGGAFAAQVDRAHDPDDALAALRERPCDLVLVNRILDRDETDGIELIRRIKADPQLAAIPVMLISNYPDAQEAAVRAGALAGFGKADLTGGTVPRALRDALA